NIGAATAVHGDGPAEIVRASAKKSRIDDARSIRRQFGDEDVIVTVVSALDGIYMREIRRFCAPCDIGIATGIDCDATGNIIANTTQVGRINQCIAAGVEFSDEDIAEVRVRAISSRVIGISGGKISRDGLTRYKNISVSINHY